jgi:hypothetical protein
MLEQAEKATRRVFAEGDLQRRKRVSMGWTGQ